jgi:hypothetical protein
VAALLLSERDYLFHRGVVLPAAAKWSPVLAFRGKASAASSARHLASFIVLLQAPPTREGSPPKAVPPATAEAVRSGAEPAVTQEQAESKPHAARASIAVHGPDTVVGQTEAKHSPPVPFAPARVEAKPTPDIWLFDLYDPRAARDDRRARGRDSAYD